MSDKERQIEQLNKQVDNAKKIISDLELDIEELLQAIRRLRSEIDER